MIPWYSHRTETRPRKHRTWQCKPAAPHKHRLPFASEPPVSELELGDPPRPKLASRIYPAFTSTKTHRLSASLTYLWTSGRCEDQEWGFAPVWTCFGRWGDAWFRRGAVALHWVTERARHGSARRVHSTHGHARGCLAEFDFFMK